MIQATFKRKYFANILCMVCGLLLIGLFVLIWYADPSAAVDDLLSGVIWGVLICLFAAVSMLHNYGAYLYIDKQGNIQGKYHFFGKIHCHISQITFAVGHFNTLVLTQQDGKTHTIMGIDQPWLFSGAVMKQLNFQVTQDPDALIARQTKLKRTQITALILTVFLSIMMFVILFATVFLTGEREMEAFTTQDWWIFAGMSVLFFVDMVAMFYFAIKIGRQNVPMQQLQYQIHRRIIETKPLPGNPVKVFTDVNYTGRLTVFGFPQDTSVYYIVERFTAKNTLNGVFQSEIFENIDKLTESVASLIDITDAVL